MKKLLAILLMLTMLVPMLALAEDTGATKTTIRVTTADVRTLTDMDVSNDVLAAVQDALDLLSIELYAADDAPITGIALLMNGMPVMSATLETNGDDCRFASSFADGAAYLNVAEDLPRLMAAVFRMTNPEADEAQWTQAATVYAPMVQQGYRGMQHLLSALALTPPELLNSIGSSIDWTKMVARINESLPETMREEVTEQPDDCDPAVMVLSFALTREQIIAICSAVLGETLTGLDSLFFGDEVMGGLTDIFCVQLSAAPMTADISVTAYLDAEGGIVKLMMAGDAEETAILTRHTSGEGVLYRLLMETTTESAAWEILLNADGVDVSYAADPIADPEQPDLVQSKERMTFRLTNTVTENGTTMLVEMHDTEQLCSGGTNWREEEQTDFTFRFDDLLIDGQQEQRTEMTLAKQGQSILTIVAETHPCAVQPPLSESDDIYDLGEMSDGRLAMFVRMYAMELGQGTVNTLFNMPENVRNFVVGR